MNHIEVIEDILSALVDLQSAQIKLDRARQAYSDNGFMQLEIDRETNRLFEMRKNLHDQFVTIPLSN